jgi:hypothetical protein
MGENAPALIMPVRTAAQQQRQGAAAQAREHGAQASIIRVPVPGRRGPPASHPV